MASPSHARGFSPTALVQTGSDLLSCASEPLACRRLNGPPLTVFHRSDPPARAREGHNRSDQAAAGTCTPGTLRSSNGWLNPPCLRSSVGHHGDLASSLKERNDCAVPSWLGPARTSVGTYSARHPAAAEAEARMGRWLRTVLARCHARDRRQPCRGCRRPCRSQRSSHRDRHRRKDRSLDGHGPGSRTDNRDCDRHRHRHGGAPGAGDGNRYRDRHRHRHASGRLSRPELEFRWGFVRRRLVLVRWFQRWCPEPGRWRHCLVQ